MLLLLAAIQAVALLALLLRLWPGRRRARPVVPVTTGPAKGAISIILPTLNEAARIGPCLEGLITQGDVVREILVVDSGSTDGTRELVEAAASRDARIRFLRDEPLGLGWIGKVWALQHGLGVATGEWILGVDADTVPNAGLAGGALTAALANNLEAVSFAPRFQIESAGERWLQPALLVTLIYRFGPTRVDADESRVMANGQCFLSRRRTLMSEGGFASARGSFSDDVTLARHLARAGHRVGFLDGSRLYDVRAYTSAAEVWREWGRSLDLKDSTSRWRQWSDVLFLLVVQGTPVPVLLVPFVAPMPLLATSAALFMVRCLLLRALAPSYRTRGWPFWLSPLADPLAAVRILLSSLRRPTQWRGRIYSN